MMNGHRVYLVAACDQQRGIGQGGTLPWRLKKEMAYFKQLTSGTTDAKKHNLVVMGRTTWESIPERFRPLPGRRNVVLSRQVDYAAPGAEVVGSFDEALALADNTIETVYVIGGGRVYTETIDHSATDGIYLTEIDQTFGCDTFFPPLPERFTRTVLGTDQEGDIPFTFALYAAA